VTAAASSRVQPAALLVITLACERAPAPERATATSRLLRASCVGLGPASCERRPSSVATLCGALTGCVKDDSGNLNLDGLLMDCKRDPFGAAPETAFTSSEPAPERSGVRSTSIVNIVASEDDAMQFGAAYLVAELAEGRCIVDPVLSWSSSFADTEFSTRWVSPPGSPPRLNIRAHRTVFTVLDRAELARGESNVLSEVCADLSYEVVAGRFSPVSRSEAAGACPDRP